MLHLTTRQYRRVLFAAVITLITSATLLGLVGFIHWRSRLALRNDTHAVMEQVGQQFQRALQSRRGTLTLFRDTLRRRPDLTRSQLEAMAASAVEHTRHLAGLGVIHQRPTVAFTWWTDPAGLSDAQRALLVRVIMRRTNLRHGWRVASTLVVPVDLHRSLLIMLEPLTPRTAAGLLVSAFELRTLVEDFFATSPTAAYPAQLLMDETPLYQSPNWRESTMSTASLQTVVKMDATRWTIRMQPGRTQVTRTLSWLNLLLIGLGGLAALGVTAMVWMLAARTWILQRAVSRRTAALRRVSERLRHMAITDELTGLYNRRFFLDRWAWEFARAKRHERPLACLMIDVNGFKQVNDRLGHDVGDLVLKQIAQELKTALRQTDILARFGGDEFIVALPETNMEQAATVAEKLSRLAVPIPGADARTGPVRLSVGVSRLAHNTTDPHDPLQAADQALYLNKRRAHEAAKPAHQIYFD